MCLWTASSPSHFALTQTPLLAAKVEDANTAAGGDGGAASASEQSPLKILMKAKFILNKHFGNATVIDGSKIRIDLGYPTEYALVSIPSFVNKQA